ncbi:MAG: hypothetical protein LBE35_09585 [Clostridiales bacterium]|jgi:hypothetical protein|nr:hypothetical protein [Clostridiales bacterium]
MSAVKAEILNEVEIMDERTAEMLLNTIKSIFIKSWEDIEEVKPDEIDLQMIAEMENDPDCFNFNYGG